METISKIKDKINSYTSTSTIRNASMSFLVIVLMSSSFMLGQISVSEPSTRNDTQVQIYLPSGELVTKDTVPDNQTALTAYVLGGASKEVIPQNGPTIEDRLNIIDSGNELLTETQSQIFGSKNGSTYYVPGCKAGNRVKLENRIYFKTEVDAEDEGYSRSKSCK